MKSMLKALVYLLCVFVVSSFQCIDGTKVAAQTVNANIKASGEFPFTIKCSDDTKAVDINDAEIPKELKDMIVLKKFASYQNQVFVYMQNGTEEDPLETGIHVAVYDKTGKQKDSSRLIDLNCDDVNNGGDGSDPKTSTQYVTFESAHSFKVFVETTSQSKGKTKSEDSYKIEESGKIVGE
ncbi:MAG: hypothetical protein Q8M29_01095 [Bacteroidota bacterium]|nr:hypothetical protein [Bacteroidota bacterium]